LLASEEPYPKQKVKKLLYKRGFIKYDGLF
jgi:hypothetical protein